MYGILYVFVVGPTDAQCSQQQVSDTDFLKVCSGNKCNCVTQSLNSVSVIISLLFLVINAMVLAKLQRGNTTS